MRRGQPPLDIDRSFRGLLEDIHAAQSALSVAIIGPVVSRVSLGADLLAGRQRNIRLAARGRQLVIRLSYLPGEAQLTTRSGVRNRDLPRRPSAIPDSDPHHHQLRKGGIHLAPPPPTCWGPFTSGAADESPGFGFQEVRG